MQDRRDFLKIFGLSSAMVASAGGKEPELITDPHPKTDQYFNTNSFDPRLHYDVVPAVLWSKLTVKKDSLKGGVTFHFQDYSAKLHAPESFLVRGIGLVFSESVPEKLKLEVRDNYDLELRIGQKWYWKSPLALMRTDCCPDDASIPELSGPQFPYLISTDKDNRGLIIPHHLNYYVQLSAAFQDPIVPYNWVEEHEEMRMWAVLSGFRARGVQ
jgi:hypothetical protein